MEGDSISRIINELRACADAFRIPADLIPEADRKLLDGEAVVSRAEVAEILERFSKRLRQTVRLRVPPKRNCDVWTDYWAAKAEWKRHEALRKHVDFAEWLMSRARIKAKAK